ncbi:sigma-70 family RNA polymerase sigma factor [bacterium]|nr:sigma-70 family RNA polymerase sigma factor [bacterium]
MSAPLLKSTKKTPQTLNSEEKVVIILEHQDFARRIAWKMLNHWRIRLESDEVESVVGCALCEAAERYDTSFDASFKTFLFYHLRGLLLREITASVRARCNIPLVLFLGDDREVIVERVLEPLTEYNTPESMIIHREKANLCKDALATLDEMEKEVLKRHFVDDQNIVDIANELGYCRCHISRVKNKAIRSLSKTVGVITKPLGLGSAALAKKNEARSKYTGGRGRRKQEAQTNTQLKLVVSK